VVAIARPAIVQAAVAAAVAGNQFVSRPSRLASPATNRERLLQDFARAALLRQLYPQLAEVRVELEFQDGTAPSPSPQAFSYYPAARGFFRYACPCHSCSGEFDLSTYVAEAAADVPTAQRIRRMDVTCTGQRAHDLNERHACPIGARIRVSVKLRKPE
jgi:hypothetical protein